MTKQLLQVEQPTMTDLLEATKRNLSASINCIQVGIIQSYDAASQTANIQIALKKILEIAADGTRILQDRPLLIKCPVVTLFGGASFLSMPIAAGDYCIVLFNDREIDQWYANGGTQAPVTYRLHDLSDGMAIVGIRSAQNPIVDYLASGVRLSYSAASKIDLTEDKIESTAPDFQHNGNMLITGGLEVDGLVTGSGVAAFKMGANVDMNGHTISGGVVSSSNGATGTYNFVTVVNGIVTSGT